MRITARDRASEPRVDIGTNTGPNAPKALEGVEIGTDAGKAPVLTENTSLNDRQVKGVAGMIIDAVDAPLATQKGRRELVAAIDDDGQQRAKARKVVSKVANDAVIGDLQIKVVDQGSARLGRLDSRLTGDVDNATLLISEGLSADNVGQEVHDAIVTLMKRVAKTEHLELNIASLQSFFAPTIRAAVSYVIYRQVLDRIDLMQQEDTTTEEVMRRVANETRIIRTTE